ncbi:hypothetical protein TNCV_5113841 [Trichonephila clavipes]|nr:hypothetical protein TNCV_5113841 [Trichonephila clavipes]
MFLPLEEHLSKYQLCSFTSFIHIPFLGFGWKRVAINSGVKNPKDLLKKRRVRRHTWFEPYSYFKPADLDSDYIEQEAIKGKGAFILALWTQYAIPKLYGLVYKARRQYGAQNLTTWTQLAQAVLDGCFGQKWPDSVFQVPDSCSICLSTMHWPEKTQCGHAFHLRCLL